MNSIKMKISENADKKVSETAKFVKKASFGLFDYTNPDSKEGEYFFYF